MPSVQPLLDILLAIPKNHSVTVDEFVESKVLLQHRGIVAELRKLMRQHASDAHEVMSYGLPMYVQKGPIAWISPNKTGITFGFRQGTAFEDKYNLLEGVGKHARNVKMKDLGEVNKPALKYYIKQAVNLDKR